MGSEIQLFTFNRHVIPAYTFRGRPCWLAQDVGKALDYTADGFGNALRGWRDELIDDKDWEKLTGAKLREFKGVLDDPTDSVGSSARLWLLYESGVDLVCLKTEKPLGKVLRRFMVDEVMPKLRRGTLGVRDRDLERLALLEAPTPSTPTIWVRSTIDDICRIHGRPIWKSGRMPRWLAQPMSMIYKHVLGSKLYKELKRRNPDPKRGSLHYQFFTEREHAYVRHDDMVRVSAFLRASKSVDEFTARMRNWYEGAPLQLGW